MVDHILPDPEGDKTQFLSPHQPLTVELMPKRLKMYYISDNELDAIAGGSNSLNWTFFGICAGGFLSCGGVLVSVSIVDAVRHASIFSTTILCGLLGIFFGIKGFLESLNNRQKLKEIKEGSMFSAPKK